jgi:filamentous hemagglutinin family protein
LLHGGVCFRRCASANPTGGTVTAGQANISSSGNTLTVNQISNNAVIDWRGFDIDVGETTQFLQNSSSAIAVNRVNSSSASAINGNLTANGNIVIINQNGVMFGAGARVDVNGLVATTADLDDDEFMRGGPLRLYKPGNPNASVTNAGTITARDAGLVGLVAPTVINSGTITARLGRVHLASGDTATVDMYGDGLLEIGVSDRVQSQLVENSGVISADGGTIALTAGAGQAIVNSVVRNTGTISAQTVENRGGVITIRAARAQSGAGGVISNTGTITASGTKGGSITLDGHNIAQQGTIRADGTTGDGGDVTLRFSGTYLDNESALVSASSIGGHGGRLHIYGTTETSNIFASGDYHANGETGGDITFEAGNNIGLYATQVSATGRTAGGTIRVGGGAHGQDSSMRNANRTTVNGAAVLDASATENGDGGSITVWSQIQTTFMGIARVIGGALGGDGGHIELSSAETLHIGNAAVTDASSLHGLMGTLLLDPKNIIIADGGAMSGLSFFQMIDPNYNAGGAFGGSAITLANGNVAVTDIFDNFMGNNAGAVYLFNGETGGLVSTLFGRSDGDQIGSNGLTALNNGNFVVASSQWQGNVGAVTWVNGVSGLVGTVDGSNSLIGSSANDRVGSGGVTALTNGNYVVVSSHWNNDAGAVTWGDGTVGITGAISSTNSLVGRHTDQLGSDGVTALANGNYVIASSHWGGTQGAVTWGDGRNGIIGDTVDETNSMVGADGDRIGSDGVIALTNGHYVVASSHWNGDAGAVTWGDGDSGTVGQDIGGMMSITGDTGDRVGSDGVVALTNGNYVVASSHWKGDMGAVTWGDGSRGRQFLVDHSNSIVGDTGDRIGSDGITALTNGNYVVASSHWRGDLGAVTWGDGNSGTVGIVDENNSLVGDSVGDLLGSDGVTALTNGHYVVASSHWGGDIGIVQWGDGDHGTTGRIDQSYALTGTVAGDRVGSDGVTALANGNYVVASSYWNGNRGAVTLRDGGSATGLTINASNSLIGSVAGDRVGNGGVLALASGNYVAGSTLWNGGAGAVTWGDGNSGTGAVGYIDGFNSFLGTSANQGFRLLAEDTINHRVVVSSLGDQKVYSIGDGAVDNSFGLYSYSAASTLTIAPGFLTATLNAGTNVLLQASNDITVNSAITANNPGGNGGALTLQAGRSILVNANITTDNGNLNLLANQNLATGVVNAHRDAGAANITINGIINAGTGSVTMQIAQGIGLTNNTSGAITVASAISGGNILLQNMNGNTVFNAGAVLNASGEGTAATVVAGGSTGAFTNNAGSGLFNMTGGGRWLVYSRNPSGNTLGGLTSTFHRYSCTYGGSCPSMPSTGNGLLYGFTPLLTIAANSLSNLIYGAVSPSLAGYAYTASGYLGSDGSIDTLTGALTGSTNYTQGSNVGSYYLNYASGSLASSLGYGFTYGNNASAITVDPRALTITAANHSLTYGAANSFNGYGVSGLYGSETITGMTLATNATLSGSGFWNVSGSTPWTITASGATGANGFNASNYNITYVNGSLTVLAAATLPTTAYLPYTVQMVSQKPWVNAGGLTGGTAAPVYTTSDSAGSAAETAPPKEQQAEDNDPTRILRVSREIVEEYNINPQTVAF